MGLPMDPPGFSSDPKWASSRGPGPEPQGAEQGPPQRGGVVRELGRGKRASFRERAEKKNKKTSCFFEQAVRSWNVFFLFGKPLWGGLKEHRQESYRCTGKKTDTDTRAHTWLATDSCIHTTDGLFIDQPMAPCKI